MLHGNYHFFISVLANVIPLVFYLRYLITRIFCNYKALINFINLLYFFIVIIFINFFFLIFFSLFFFFNCWRFLKFFRKLGHFVYFKKLSIYFTFWQYLCIYIYKYIYNIILYIFMYFFNIILFIYNKYFFKLFINNLLIFFLIKQSFNSFKNIYNYIIILKKILYNSKFIEYFFYIYYIFFSWKKDINNKFVDDPFIYRNQFIKIYNRIDHYFNLIITANFFIKGKRKVFFSLIYILNNYVKNYIYLISNLKLNIYVFEIIYNDIIKILLLKIKNNIYLLYIYIYILFLNFIYFLIIFNVYILFYIFNIIKIFIEKYNYLLKILVILIFLFYFSWLINYFFIMLYKHYFLYIPLFNVKENFHFINFEWIDLRNYFNIIKLHNVLIDLNIHNNVFYNEIIKQLNQKVVTYNFKISQNFNINLFTDQEITNKNINGDTVLLKNIFEKWNKYHGGGFIRRWRKYKRMLNWSLRHTFKGKGWYDAVKKEKLKSSNLSFFNNNRYFENTKTDLLNKMGFWDNLHQIKQLPYNKDVKMQFQKTQAWYTYFKKKHTSRKRPRFLLSYYIKLKNIPFSYIYKEFDMFFLEKYKIKNIKNINYNFEKYFQNYKKIEKIVFFLKKIYIDLKFIKFNNSTQKIFFFKKYFRNFIDTQTNLVFKNKIPTLLVTELRLQRLPPISTIDRYYKDHIMMGNADEMHQLIYYSDLAKKSCIKNIIFKVKYIYKKYPYNINKKTKYYQYAIKNYFNIIETGGKIYKKFFFFERSKLRNFNKFSHRLLNKIDTVYGNQLLKYKYWDRVFYLKRLNKKKLDFWGFFDYLKTNKYVFSKEDTHFTVFFLNRWKKDYYHMRVYLLRIISFLHYYTLYKKIKMNNNLTFFNLIKNVKLEGGPISLESLSTLNSLKYLNDMNKKNDNIMEQTQEQEQINEFVFHHFKLRWHFRELLNSNGIDSFGNKEKFMFLINLFFKKFNKYFIEYEKINKYNNKYNFKIKSYKIKVLRKIKNLKKFFFFNTKRNRGYRIFSFLNTLSISYHFKHLFWHSPYSYYLFKKNNILNNIKYINTFYIYYFYKNNKYNVTFYSYIFNLLLNIVDIKEEWAYYLTDNIEYSINYNILKKTFYYSYNYGNFYFFYLNELDIFRLFNSLLKNYYNNFLIKLTRYRFVLEKNNYNSVSFIIRYLKQWYNSCYLKIRYFIYQTHETYVRYLKKKYLYFLRKKYWIRNRVDVIPFWFLFDYYMKCLIKYLFNQYFIKEHFIYWWLNYRLNFSFFFFLWLNMQKFKFYNIMFFKKSYIIKLLIKYWSIIINIWYYYIYNDIIYLLWYFNIINNNFIFLIIMEYNIDKLFFLYKLIFFNYFFNVKINVIKILNYIIDLKDFLNNKFNIKEFSNFIMKYIQNIKNRMIYFKSNYYYFKKQKLIRKRKRRVPLYSFLSTNLKRNWFSLKNRSSNFFAFYNIYFLNLKNIYFLKKNLDLNNFFFFLWNQIPILNKKFFKKELSFFWIYYIYIFLLLFLFFINKKFFKMFFINKKYEMFNLDLNILNKKNNNVFNSIYNLSKKNLYYYKFFLFKSKSSKYLNFINIYNDRKYKWFKNFLNLKFFLNYTSFDQFKKNKPIYKSNIFITTFFNINKFNNYIKSYMKFFLIKKNFMINLCNDHLSFYEFSLKKENISYKFKNLTDLINFNYIFFYWIFLIPYFIIQYIIIKYHFKFYIKTKRRFSYVVRTFFDNMRLFVKINKYLGRSFFKSMYKSKRWKDPSHVFLSKKRSKRNHFSTNYLRFRKLYYRLSPLGGYYYWFSKINLVQYMISYKNFFFNTIIKSYYYWYFIIIYLMILLFFFKRFYKYKDDKKFKFLIIFKKIEKCVKK